MPLPCRLSEGFSHVAAIMFKVESAVRNGYTAATSSLCRWNQIFTKNVRYGLHLFYVLALTIFVTFMWHEPARIIDIKFIHRKHAIESHSRERSSICQPPIACPTFEDKSFNETIQSLFPTSGVLSVTTMKIDPRVNHGVARQLPPIVSDEEQYNESEQVLKMIKFSMEDSEYLAEATKMQSESLLWFEHRKGRITASPFGAVCNTSAQNPSKSLIEAIPQKKLCLVGEIKRG